MPMPARRFSNLGLLFGASTATFAGKMRLHIVTPMRLADAHVEYGRLVQGLRAIAAGDEPRAASQAQRLLSAWGPGQADPRLPEPRPAATQHSGK